MPRSQLARNPLFSRRRFADDVIILCVRWYHRFKISYREMSAIAWELGVSVAPSTILRWVIRYSTEFEKRWRAFERSVGRSWRADETYVSVGGKWMFLYRAVDQHGKTIESYLSRTRDKAAAKTFFRKALKRHGEPRTITLDGFEPSHSALRVMGMRNEFNFILGKPGEDALLPLPRLQPMLGLKKPYDARRVIAGVELAHKIHKQQYDIPRQFGSFPAEVWRNVLAT